MVRQFFIVILVLTSQALMAQEGKDILRKHFKAHGQDLWKEMNSVIVDGKWVDADYHSYPMKLTYKYPGKIRLEGTYQNKRFAEATDGQLSWIIAPWKPRYEVQLMSTAEEIVIKNSFSRGSPLYPVKDHLTFLGLSDMEGILYYTYLMEEASFRRTFYIDQKDFRLYYEKIESKFDGTPISVLKTIEKYKQYNGLLVPTAVYFKGDDFERELVFDEIYVGMGANDDLFQMPNGQ
ncbi:hypothetical protein [Marinoscillum sp. 108]|uniref:hypothetical protein n=1 Tax=Marinoscillum sp. 108 TaxID=2653151 RepID=UPI0012F4312A|nr:hypothetical protein [Marinoscillum sp. 108]VXD18505.1 conserved exported hypothetical protein [Marinoscillum sp. 108]